MKVEISFGVGQTEIRLRECLPLPAEPLPVALGCAEQFRGSALQQIEELLPVALSELLWGRSELRAPNLPEGYPGSECRAEPHRSLQTVERSS